MTAPRATSPDGPEEAVPKGDTTISDGHDDIQRPDDGPSFECRIAFAGDAARVVPFGEIDLETAPLVEQRLELVRAAGAAHVVLDLSETTFIDSSGLHLALAWQERARRERFEFALTPGSAAVRRAIDAAGIGAFLTFVSEAP